MRATQLVAELIIIGILFILGILYIMHFPIIEFLKQYEYLSPIVAAALFCAITYITGFYINVFAELAIKPLHKAAEARTMAKEGNPAVILRNIRYDLYASAQREVIQRLEYHRSLLRLARSIGFGALIITALALAKLDLSYAGISASITIISAYAYYRRVIWFTRSAYYSWLAMIHYKNQIYRQADQRSFYETILENDPKLPLRILTFTGGTGFREINIALSQKNVEITRVVPVFDNGGSSKILREHFKIMPIGDIRHALMTMAYGEGRVGNVVRLFNWRLSEEGTPKELVEELIEFTTGKHPFIKFVEPSLKNIIIAFLKKFESMIPPDIDLRNGSIGNFTLLGAYYSMGDDINSAIHVFRELCSIKGFVWPVSIDNDLHIGAELENGDRIIGQNLVTNINRNAIREKITRIFFTRSLDKSGREITNIKANPMVIESIQKADIIVFGPGSFFTSILPHLMVSGIVDEIAKFDVPKIFVGNMLEGKECYNFTIEELVDIFLNTANQFASSKISPDKYLTNLFVHDIRTNKPRSIHENCYLRKGESITRFQKIGIKINMDDFEDPWRRGYHDPRYIVDLLTNINKLRKTESTTTN